MEGRPQTDAGETERHVSASPAAEGASPRPTRGGEYDGWAGLKHCVPRRSLTVLEGRARREGGRGSKVGKNVKQNNM